MYLISMKRRKLTSVHRSRTVQLDLAKSAKKVMAVEKGSVACDLLHPAKKLILARLPCYVVTGEKHLVDMKI